MKIWHCHVHFSFHFLFCFLFLVNRKFVNLLWSMNKEIFSNHEDSLLKYLDFAHEKLQSSAKSINLQSLSAPGTVKLMQPTCKQSKALQKHLKLIRATDYPNYSQLSQLSPKGTERPPA